MLNFLIRRVVSGLLLIATISLLVFALLYLGAGDIARNILGETASEELVAKKAAELGLDRPFFVQYWDWLSRAVTGDLGRSWLTTQPVAEGIQSRIAVTLSLVIGTTLLSAVLAVVLGVAAARIRGPVDSTIQVVTMLGLAVPGFVIALYLVLVFALQLGWFRATGYVPIQTSFAGWLGSVTLPILALSAAVVATVAQQVRGAVIDAMSRDYVRTLRSRGLPMRSVVYKHVLRNASGPALAVLAVQFVGLLGGTVIVEQIFAIPGLGQLSVQATTQGDMPAVMGVVLVFAIIVVIVNVLVDLAQAGLNPKVRLS